MSRVQVKCRRCRLFLLTGDTIVNSHGEPREGEAGQVGCDTDTGTAATHLFVSADLAPSWLADTIAQACFTQGKILCPKCQGRLGSFDFVRSVRKCHCGRTSQPPVHLLRDRVDVMDYSRQHPVTVPTAGGRGRIAGQRTVCDRSNCVGSRELKQQNTLCDTSHCLKSREQCREHNTMCDTSNIAEYREVLRGQNTMCGTSHSIGCRELHREHNTMYGTSNSIESREVFKEQKTVCDTSHIAESRELWKQQKAMCGLTREDSWNSQVENLSVEGRRLGTDSPIVGTPHSAESRDLCREGKTIRGPHTAGSGESQSLRIQDPTVEPRRLGTDHSDIEKSRTSESSDQFRQQSPNRHRRLGIDTSELDMPHTSDSGDQLMQKNPNRTCSCGQGTGVGNSCECGQNGYRSGGCKQPRTVQESNSFLHDGCLYLARLFGESEEELRLFGESEEELRLFGESEELRLFGESEEELRLFGESEELRFFGESEELRLLGESNQLFTVRGASQEPQTFTDPHTNGTVQGLPDTNSTCDASATSPHMLQASRLTTVNSTLRNRLADSGDFSKVRTIVRQSRRQRRRALKDAEAELRWSRLDRRGDNYWSALDGGERTHGGHTARKTWAVSEAERQREKMERKQKAEETLELEEVSWDHTCPLCLEVMVSPHTTLPCRHHFCECCLRRLSATATTTTTTNCPLCRQPIASCVPNAELDRAIARHNPLHLTARRRELRRHSQRLMRWPLPGVGFPGNCLARLRSQRPAPWPRGNVKAVLVVLVVLVLVLLANVGMGLCRCVLSLVAGVCDGFTERLTGERPWSEFMGLESRVVTVSCVFVLYLLCSWLVNYFRVFGQILY